MTRTGTRPSGPKHPWLHHKSEREREREREQAPTHVSHRRLRQRATLPCAAHVVSRCDALQATEQPEQRSQRTRYRIGFEVVGASASVDQHVLHHLLWLGFLQETERARVRGTMARMARGEPARARARASRTRGGRQSADVVCSSLSSESESPSSRSPAVSSHTGSVDGESDPSSSSSPSSSWSSSKAYACGWGHLGVIAGGLAL